MDRRQFLTAKQANQNEEIITPPDTAPRTNSNLNPYSGAWTDNEVIHLLKRTTFGAAKKDIDYFKTRTLSQAVDELINPTAPIPTPPVKDYDTSGSVTIPDTNIADGTTWVNDPNTDSIIQVRRRSSFKKWWMGVMINQDRSIREKMNFFWHNHFSTETNDVLNPQYIYKHHALLRQNALGNFKTLVRAVTIDPAMLVYLNGSLNSSTAPDENYSRELQELFCCGKGSASLFTENDVKEAAKVLTGWRNTASTISSYFDSTRHNTANKTFSAFYNNTTIIGKSGATAGDAELDDLLNMIFSVQEVAKYICRRLYRWFVYYDIDAAVENNIITPLANIFRANNYEIKPVLSALLKSEHFFDVLNQGCQIKSPVDFIVGLNREFNVVYPTPSDYISNYGLWNTMVTYSSLFQQSIGDPPDVSGWKAYYQVPQFYEIWINSDTLPKRNQFSDLMVSNGYTFNAKKIFIDGSEFAKTLSNPADPNVLINDILKIIYRMPLTAASRNKIKIDILLSGQTSDHYWTDAWNLFISTPSNTNNATTVRNKLRDLIKYFMNLAEYHLA